MQQLTVIENVTLDGVMQAPGRADEDTRDGFRDGGWAVPYGDEMLGRAMGERMTCGGSLVLGRRTYEDFAGYWPGRRRQPVHAGAGRGHEARRLADAPRPVAVAELRAARRRRRRRGGGAQAGAGARASASSAAATWCGR